MSHASACLDFLYNVCFTLLVIAVCVYIAHGHVSIMIMIAKFGNHTRTFSRGSRCTCRNPRYLMNRKVAFRSHQQIKKHTTYFKFNIFLLVRWSCTVVSVFNVYCETNFCLDKFRRRIVVFYCIVSFIFLKPLDVVDTQLFLYLNISMVKNEIVPSRSRKRK